MNRRDFLARAGATLISAPLLASSVRAVSGANERIRVAVMGVRGRGRSHVAELLRIPEVDIPYICDVDKSVVGPMVERVAKARGKEPVVVADIRKVLDDKSIDAVSIATPNHWHALATIWACQAGKDVYVEKPISHTVVEGRRIVEASRKYGRIVQTGTQSRTHQGAQAAVEFLRSGKLGKVSFARAIVYKTRNSIGKHARELPVPEGVDYNLWTGPAPLQPILRNQLHYDWHWRWDYGNGEMGNTGVHQIDMARLGLNKGMPTTVVSVAGRFGYDDDGETPNTQLALFGYDDCRILCEIRALKTDAIKDVRIGEIWYGSEGTLIRDLSSGVARAYLGKEREAVDLGDKKGNQDLPHFQNFIAAMRSRKHEDLKADCLEGHISSAMCHLANISHRLGKDVPFDARTEALASCKEAGESWQQLGAHLRANGLDLGSAKYRLGRTLQFDPKNETVPGDQEANGLLTQAYRAPFVCRDGRARVGARPA